MSAAGPGGGGGTAPFFSTHHFKKPPKLTLAYQQKLEGRHQAPPPFLHVFLQILKNNLG